MQLWPHGILRFSWILNCRVPFLLTPSVVLQLELVVSLVTCVTWVNIQFSTWRHDGPCWLLQNEQLNVGHIFPAQAACEMFHTTFMPMELHWIGIANAIELILWSSGKCQARMGKGWPLRRKASKLKPKPRAYTKVSCNPPPPPPASLIILD